MNIMNIMKYKNYVARIEYDEEDLIFVGHLAGIKDIVGFHGTTVTELEDAFHESVDNYIAISALLLNSCNKKQEIGAGHMGCGFPALVKKQAELHKNLIQES